MSDVRRHGLQWPWSGHQIGSLVGVAYTIASFILVLSPTIVDHIIFFSVFALGLIVFLVTVLIDPHVTPEQDPAEANRFCNSCELSMGPRTKHCRICNKCIYRFDHHCLYLNTCIGGRNYRPFFTLVSLTVTWLSIYLAFAILACIKAIQHSDSHDGIYGSTLVYLSVLGCVSLVPLFMFIAILSLWMFHIYIGFLRVSTYDWIIGKRHSDSPIEMPVQQSERRQEEIQARRQEIYEQWVRQNRLRQQQQEQQQDPLPQQPSQQQQPLSAAVITKPDNQVDGVVNGADVKIEMFDEQVPRNNSESILSQVEDVLGIDINVNEGQPRPAMARRSRASSLASPIVANIVENGVNQDPVR